jgi:predicted PurR-regulated permease PerM
MRSYLPAIALVFGIAFIFYAHDTLLLIFAGLLLALVLRAAAEALARVVRIPIPFALAIVFAAVIAVFSGALAWRGATIADQFVALAKTLPAAAQTLLLRSGAQPWDVWLREHIATIDSAATWRFVTGAGWVLSSIFGSLTGAAVVVFTGVCFAAEPGTYVGALVRLVPPTRRRRITVVLTEVGVVLRSWLLARLISMTAVGVFVSIGLVLLHIPFAGTLGILAGLLAFIPNIGSIASAIPPLVLALAIDVRTAIFVALLFWLAHFIDDFLVLPVAERRIVHLPPALTVTMQLLLVVPAGILGIMLAAPLSATGIVLARRLFIEDVLERDQALTPETVVS